MKPAQRTGFIETIDAPATTAGRHRHHRRTRVPQLQISPESLWRTFDPTSNRSRVGIAQGGCPVVGTVASALPGPAVAVHPSSFRGRRAHNGDLLNHLPCTKAPHLQREFWYLALTKVSFPPSVRGPWEVASRGELCWSTPGSTWVAWRAPCHRP